MDILILFLIVLILAGVFGGPWWGYSRNWGYSPFGLVVVLLLVVLVIRFAAGPWRAW